MTPSISCGTAPQFGYKGPGGFLTKSTAHRLSRDCVAGGDTAPSPAIATSGRSSGAVAEVVNDDLVRALNFALERLELLDFGRCAAGKNKPDKQPKCRRAEDFIHVRMRGDIKVAALLVL